MNKFSSIFYILVIIVFSFFFRFHNLSNFFSYTDDQLVIEQLIKYENLDIYSIANDKESPSYDGLIKKKLIEIEKKDIFLVNKFQKYISKFIFNMVPSKHSTFAPMQYALFGWMVSPDQSYKELKLYSRIPSAILSVLTVFMIYLISLKLFKKNNFLQLYPALFSSISLPLIYISQRSYNYSASAFAYLILIFIFLKQFSSKKNSLLTIKDEEIQHFNNTIMSITLASLAYLNYQLLVIMPIFFLYLFVHNFINFNKIISYFSINLFLIGLIYSILVTPLLLYMMKLDLNEYGVTGSTGGEYLEYALNAVESNTKERYIFKQSNLVDTIYFFMNNTYLVISKNLSFFTDKFFHAEKLQFIIFILTIYGLCCVYLIKNKNKIFKNFTNLILLTYIYWCILTFFNITNLGPTRHLQIFTPVLTVFLSYGLYNLICLLKTEYSKKITSIILTLSIITIFTLDYKSFLNYYEDPFNEIKINKSIDQFNIGYIMNSPSFSHNLCFMNSIKVKVHTCPQSIDSTRHNYVPHEPDLDEIKLLKSKGKSLVLLNYMGADEIYKKHLKETVKINTNIIKKLELAGFKLIQKINEDKFSFESPLYISKYKPNMYTLYVYK